MEFDRLDILIVDIALMSMIAIVLVHTHVVAMLIGLTAIAAFAAISVKRFE